MTEPVIDPTLDAWLRAHHQAVLITLRRDGSPQSSNVSFSWKGQSARVSVTTARAKSRNAQRNPRVGLHVLGDTFWQTVAIQGRAEVSAPTTSPGDDVGRELLEVYESITGPHPDNAEFFQAMVDQHRQIISVRPIKAIANID